MLKGRIALAATLLIAGAGARVEARDIYVSSETGKEGTAGTKEAPRKLLWKVMNELQPGDHVFVAEGRQEGQSKCGLMPRCEVSNVILEGGWAKDFSERDPFKHLTIIGPPGDQAGSTGKVFHFERPDNKLDNVTIDGFCIDRGQTNSYYATGESGPNKAIEGHVDNSPWGYRAINRKTSGSDPTIQMIGLGGFTIRNMILINNPWWGIYVKCGGNGTTTIENNLVLISQGRGIEALVGGGWGKPTIVIKNNTVAFNHTLASTEGRALSTDPKPGTAKYVIEKNVLAFSDGGGVDTKFDAKGDSVTLTDNLFFFNRRGDFCVGDGKGANVEAFEELSVNNSANTHELPKFIAKLQKEWVDRWSQRGFCDMLAGNFNKWDELLAARKSVGLTPEYHLIGYEKQYEDYKSLPNDRPNYDMSRYPHPMKKGDVVDFAAAVMPILGADGARGVQPFKK